ncbi:MAG: hypothetical protein M1348_03540 [Candidatus Parvarchaeota archaeon]|jgi:hypothetical protein|nr:hypothetical protein [Candidatus Parvarchaeota archaeon]
MAEKSDLEVKLFQREESLMDGESLGPCTLGATDPEYQKSEIYQDNIAKNAYEELGSKLLPNKRLTPGAEAALIHSIERDTIDYSIHELSHQYGKCKHSDPGTKWGPDEYIEPQLWNESIRIKTYSQKNFEMAIKNILDWCA